MTDLAVDVLDPGAEERRPRRPAPNVRLRDLDRVEQALSLGLVVVLGLLPLLSAAIVLHEGWLPTGDNALIGLRINDVLSGHLPLIGQPTTGENFGSGVVSSHPGPIEFYVVAPFVLVLGPQVGLALGAAAINAAALAATSWLALRRGGLGLQVLVSVVAVVLCRSLGGNLLHDPVSSNLGSMSVLLLVLATWSMVVGDLRAAPVFVVSGTFLLQDHLTYLGTCAPVVLIGLGAAGWWIRELWRRERARAKVRRVALSSGVIGVVLWLPVLVDEVSGEGNLVLIWKTFTGKRAVGEGLLFGVQRLAEALAPVPVFARRIGPLGYLHTPDTLELIGGFLIVGLLTSCAVLLFAKGRWEVAALDLVVLVALLAGVYSAVKLPLGAGIQAANLRWMWTTGAAAWVAATWSVWQLVPEGFGDRFGARSRRALVGVGVVVVLVLGGVVTASVGLDTDRDGRLMDDLDPLLADVRAELPKGTYRVTYAGGTAVVSVGPAIVYDLDSRGDRLFADVGPFTRAYASHRAYEGQPTDGTLLISTDADAAPEGARLLAEQTFAVNRRDSKDRIPLWVYLVPAADAQD